MTATERPLGVSLLAVLLWLNAVVYGALAILAVASPSTVSSLLGTATPSPAQGPSGLLKIGGVLPLYFLLMAGIVVLLGYGLWTVRNWARVVIVTLAGISVIAGLPGLVRLASNFNWTALSLTVLRLIVAAVVILYLFARTVRGAFATAKASRA